MNLAMRRGSVAGVVIVAAVGIAVLWSWWRGDSQSNDQIRAWLNDAAPDTWAVAARTQCPDAPFSMPSEGFIGLLYRDTARPYNRLNLHTGIDFFGQGPPGSVPIYAVYDGYLTRRTGWRSTVAIRHDDPLQPGRIIYTYYTHMASVDGAQGYISADFPPGTRDVFVERGTLLGYQGDYNPSFPVAMHLHFSIVLADADGVIRNEADIRNTLDPSPYFGVALRVDTATAPPRTCNQGGGA